MCIMCHCCVVRDTGIAFINICCIINSEIIVDYKVKFLNFCKNRYQLYIYEIVLSSHNVCY